jgi:protocatechuate 3,4-dioxygenase beta subunit
VLGVRVTERLVTQMYFPGDPLFYQDPIFNGVRDEAARKRLICVYDHDTTVEEWATGYRFDIVLGGAAATPLEDS